MRRLVFRTIHDFGLMLDREAAGREASPSGGLIDSQNLEASSAKARGYDAGKKVLELKRRIAVDTDGRLVMAKLATDEISDDLGRTNRGLFLVRVSRKWTPVSGKKHA